MAGANYTLLGNQSFSPTGYKSDYDQGALTPTVSLIYKVLPWLTTYASYQQSLQQGAYVLSNANTIYTNSGTILPPYLGYQYEVWVKATVGTNILLTAALYDINKADIYTVANPNGTFTENESGREDHKGLELTAAGKVTDDLTLIAGFNAMNARITNDTAAPAQNGSIPEDVSPITGKLYVEYKIPYIDSLPYLKGLTLIGGFQHAGFYYTDQPNMT